MAIALRCLVEKIHVQCFNPLTLASNTAKFASPGNNALFRRHISRYVRPQKRF
jgi:hypothetical protein